MINAWIEGVSKVSWIENGSISIGYHACSWCYDVTPKPPDSIVIDFVKRYPNAASLWPSRDPRDGWQPPGWKWHNDSDIDAALLCPSCSEALQSAVRNARDTMRNNT